MKALLGQTALTNPSAADKATTAPLLNIASHAYNPPPGGDTDGAFDQRIAQDADRTSRWYPAPARNRGHVLGREHSFDVGLGRVPVIPATRIDMATAKIGTPSSATPIFATVPRFVGVVAITGVTGRSIVILTLSSAETLMQA
ncbi:MAG: hypothetical protein WAT09_00055 [Paracoccaceae bacterium]